MAESESHDDEVRRPEGVEVVIPVGRYQRRRLSLRSNGYSRAMPGLRERVRRALPYSTVIYEDIDRRRRMRRSKPIISEMASSGRPIKLDLGGGYRKGSNGWVTVDISHECDLFWDLRRGIPFADGTVDAVYSSHLFEHLTYEQGQALMAESMRVLKPGGSFSIVVPNARLYIDHYMGTRELPDSFFGWREAYHNSTRIDALNYIAYMAGEHTYMFDIENLLFRLEQAGFVHVRERPFDPAIDMQERDYESIYAEGFKAS